MHHVLLMSDKPFAASPNGQTATALDSRDFNPPGIEALFNSSKCAVSSNSGRNEEDFKN